MMALSESPRSRSEAESHLSDEREPVDRRTRPTLKDPAFWILILLAAVYFFYRYAIDSGRPGVSTPKGWFVFSDQGSYLQMARELSTGRLEGFPYGLGYPIVAVPVLWLGFSTDPFLPFNALAFLATVGATYLTGARFSSRAVGGLAVLLIVFASPLVEYTLIPWSSTVSLLALAIVLLIALNDRMKPWHALVSGAMVGLAFDARYVDAFWLAPIVLAGILGQKEKLKLAALTAMAALVVVAPALAAHQSFYGSIFRTPYTIHVPPPGVEGPSDQDLGAFSLKRIPWAAYGMFVSPYLRGARQPGTPLLASMFWVLAIFPGIFMLRKARGGGILLTATVSGLVSTLFYLSFRQSGPAAIQFGSLHYFKMFWPLAALVTAYVLITTWYWLRPRGKRPENSLS